MSNMSSSKELVEKLKNDKAEVEKKAVRLTQQINNGLQESIRLRGELDALTKVIADLEKDETTGTAN